LASIHSGTENATPREPPPPNEKDKLPGRLQQRHFSKSRDAGAVNFIAWFGADILKVPASRVALT
jgi:hypothetical protein